MAGRPTKLNNKVIDAFTEVINSEVLFTTDEELVMLVNDVLPEESRFTYDAFSKWKREKSQSDNPIFPQFLHLIKKALFKEKKRLLDCLQNDDKSWQRFAWILERKFDEWNIKIKSETDLNIKEIPRLGRTIIKKHGD